MAKAGKVWHVYHYAELFRAVGQNGSELEMVKYSQRPIVGFNQYAEQYIQQITALKQTLPLTEFLVAKHVFDELLDHSQRHHNGDKYLRGYILDERKRPAGTARIALMVGMKTSEIERILKILEKIGLIERAEMPAWTSSGSGTTRLQEAAKGSKKEKEKDKPRPSASENEEENKYRPSASKPNGKSKAEGAAVASPKGKTTAETTADAVQEGVTPTGTAKPNAEEQAESEGNLKAQGKREVEPAASLPPTTTPPIADLPTETDGGGDGKSSPAKPSPLDNYPDDGRLNRLYDPQAKEFAGFVYEAVGSPYPVGSPECARELASFASMWQEAMRQLGKPTLLTEAWNTGIKHAKQLGKARKRNPKKFRKSPEAVWCAKFKGLIAKLKPG